MQSMQYAAGKNCECSNHWIGNAREAVGCISFDESSINIQYFHGEIVNPAAPESPCGMRHLNLEDILAALPKGTRL